MDKRLLDKLMLANETYTERKTLQKNFSVTEAQSDAKLIIEMHYHSRFVGMDYNLEKLLLSVCAPKLNIKAIADINIIRKCIEYTKQRLSQFDVLTPVDLIKISNTLTNMNEEPLSGEQIHLGIPMYVKDMWEILHELYNPANELLFILKSAIAFYKLLVIQFPFELVPSALSIFLSAVSKDELLFFGICELWPHLINPNEKLSDDSEEDALIKILTVFEHVWKKDCERICCFQEKSGEIQKTIHTTTPKFPTNGISLLTDYLCINNSTAQIQMQTSMKTTINYLKVLEHNGFLFSEKICK